MYASLQGQRTLIEFTERARDQILEFLEGDQGLAVRIRVRSPNPFAPNYEMFFVEVDDKEPGDEAHDGGGFVVFIDPLSAPLVRGTQIEWVESSEGTGFKFDNPSLRPPGSEVLQGPLAERVQQVLEEQINPGIAAHGGQISLVDLRDKTVYLRMSGGCQGCGQAAATLSQGIRQVLLTAIPEIEAIEDVTDHGRGLNPYFRPDPH